jgi:hypothetical protein
MSNEKRVREDEVKSWDAEEAYEKHCEPLVLQLQAACKEHNIPMFFLAISARNEKSEKVASCVLLGIDERHSRTLTDAYRITKPTERSGFIEELVLENIAEVLGANHGL